MIMLFIGIAIGFIAGCVLTTLWHSLRWRIMSEQLAEKNAVYRRELNNIKEK